MRGAKSLVRGLVACSCAAAATGFLTLTATGARADASFVGSTPANEQNVPAPLSEVQLSFSDPVSLEQGETRLLDSAGTDLIYEAVTADDGVTWLLEPAMALNDGIYGVIWQASAADGHEIRGVIRFGVGDEQVQPDATATQSDSSLNEELVVAEAAGTGGGGGPVASFVAVITNVGLIIAWGAALFIGFVARSRMTWISGYMTPLMRLTGLVAVVGSLIDVALQVLGDSSWNLITAGVLRLVAGAALAALPSYVNGSPGIWILSLLIIVSYAIDGHTITTTPVWLIVAADSVHVTFAAIWAGGLVALSVALAHILRRRREPNGQLLVDGTELAIRFSRYATYSVFAVALTGIMMAYFILPSMAALFGSFWGWTLVVKVILVIALAGYGAMNHYGVIPELEYADVQRDTMDVAAVEREHLVILRRRVVPEMALVLGILVASGVLVHAPLGVG